VRNQQVKALSQRRRHPLAAAALLLMGLLVTGGSDYHGDPPGPSGPPSPGAEKRLGHVPLPHAAWDRFAAALEARGA
jgi:hypothetical protein